MKYKFLALAALAAIVLSAGGQDITPTPIPPPTPPSPEPTRTPPIPREITRTPPSLDPPPTWTPPPGGDRMPGPGLYERSPAPTFTPTSILGSPR